MANRELNTAVAAETTLSASLSAGATTLSVTSTASFPAVPFAVVVDPDVDAKREVIVVDSGKTATSMTLTAASKRGQDGTSDVAHDSGAKVVVVPVPSLWADLHDRVEAHTHSGATDGAAVATGDLTGHDKPTHDALLIDADTVDGSHAADLLARANHTGTQAVSTLSDHDKAAHDALSIDAATLNGESALGLRQVVTFTSSGTFSKGSYSWLRAVRVLAQGGGGGGAGAGNSESGAGGGGGGCGVAVVDVASLGTSETVTVGAGGSGGAAGSSAGSAGGTSSFGAHATGTGGGGGNITSYLAGSGGSGTGDVVFAGSDGGNGGARGTSAQGGASHLGGGAKAGRSTSTGGAGQAGKTYGGGGGGGSADGSSTNMGGDGADGIVIVELYA